MGAFFHRNVPVPGLRFGVFVRLLAENVRHQGFGAYDPEPEILS